MKIFPLSEGAFTVDKTKEFVPFDKAKDQMTDRAAGSLLVEIQPFCIVTSQDTILIDTGLGFKSDSGRMSLHQNLIDQGIDPEAVTKVLISHLHKDHSAGISQSNGQLSFPHATYYVNKNEFDFAMRNENSSYRTKDFAMLEDAAHIVFTPDEGVIDDYIYYEVTGAHSPHHQVFCIRENGETIFFGGDVAPQMQQLKNKFIAKYDFDGRKAMELRQEWKEKGLAEKWTFMFYHDIKTPTGVL